MVRSSIVMVAAILLSALLAVIQCTPSHNQDAGSASGALIESHTKINWKHWDARAFDEAAKKQQLVFLSLSPAWSSLSSKMDVEDFSLDSVADLINKFYSPIRVDPDRYPNIYDRYHLGGYPSNVILTPDGRTIGGGTYMPPDSLMLLLGRIHQIWMENPAAVFSQADYLQNLYLKATQETKPNQPSEVALLLAEDAIKRQFDSTYAGFGVQPKFLLPDVFEFLFGAVDPSGKPMFRELTLKSLDGQLALLDTVWGGFYRYATFADWTGKNCEKLLDLNAEMLSLYLDAYQLTGDSKYRHAAELTIAYLERFLKTGSGWGFFNSQQGTIYIDGKFIDPQEYFALPDAGRMKYPVPAIDKSTYTEPNCLAVRAYLKAKRVLGKSDCGDYAEKTLDMIWSKARGDDDGLYRDAARASDSPLGLVNDHVAMIMAMLDSYETYGNTDHLQNAQQLAQFIGKHLVDPKTGGLNYEPTSDNARGRMSMSMRPLNVNCDAVVAYMRLFHLTSDTTYWTDAQRVLRSLFSTPIKEYDLRLSKLATSYLWTATQPVRFVMVGERGEAYSRLLQAAWATYYPRSTMIQLEVGRDKLVVGDIEFPSTGKPTLYVCGPKSVSAPINDPATATDAIKAFLRTL